LDNKLTKNVGHFEETKFSVGCHQFLLDYCPKLIKTYNFGQNADNKRQMINKNDQRCTLSLFIIKKSRLFVDSLSAVVSIVYRDTFIEEFFKGYPSLHILMIFLLLIINCKILQH
jgi:hypothetical protein